MASTTESIAAEVRAEVARYRRKTADVARVLQCDQSAASRKMNAKVPFTVADLTRIADMLGIDVTRFYSGATTPVVVESTSAYTDAH